MARCLADPSPRCHDAAALRLDDVDWRGGSGICHPARAAEPSNCRCPIRLGRPWRLPRAWRRSKTPSRAVFVQHRVPVGAAAGKATVRGAVRRAFVRAALPWSGTHIPGHAAATRMIQGGSSLKLVADVLRHRSIDTTASYAKVDLPNLSRVAGWAGVCPGTHESAGQRKSGKSRKGNPYVRRLLCGGGPCR